MTDREKMEYIIKTALELKELAKETGVDIRINTSVKKDYVLGQIGTYDYVHDGDEGVIYHRPPGEEWRTVTPEQVKFSGSPGGAADGC